MLFNSYAFIFGFLPVVVAGFFVLGRPLGLRAACWWLAAASLFFYGWWRPPFLVLLVGSILVNAALGRYLATTPARWRTWALAGGVIFNLALLGYFKYAEFIVVNLNHLASAHLWIPHVILPIGISFFTFQQIAYLSDSARGRVRKSSFVDYVLFVTFFPQLIAGPIVHHGEMMPQFGKPSVIRLEPSNIALGLSIFTVGLFKKTVLADVTATWADPAFSAAAAGVVLDPVQAWVAALAFSFQLYFDFSGYSDMAVGLGRMFNIVLPVNFYSPYKAVNLIEFWRRWHMTLSRFLRDYLYIPLGGNRRGALRRYANVLVVMALGGLWHGAAWTFVAWGTLHGLMLMVNHGWHALRGWVGLAPRPDWRPGRIASTAVTFFVVVCAWVFFRAADVATAWAMLRSMFGLNGVTLGRAAMELAREQFAQLGQVARMAVVVVEGGPHAPARLAELNPAGAWLVALGLIVFVAPNTYQLFAAYKPALLEWTPGTGRFDRWPRWRMSLAWAAGLGLMFVASVLQLLKISPFLYFQF